MVTTIAPTSTSRKQTATGTRGRKPVNPGRVAAWAAMIIIILITLFPFYWMLRTSFSTSKALFLEPGRLGPVDFTLGAYKRVLGLASTTEAQAEGGSGASVDFFLYLRN